jgi:catechol 2,3-dioxygenase-like lactoylglutathione lyase family enzyme
MITIDHIGLPAQANEDAARRLAHILGTGYDGPDRNFAPVHVNPHLTIDFYTAEHCEPLHIAFLAGNKEFDAIVQRLRPPPTPTANDPNDPANGRLDHPLAPRGLYFRTPDGHLIEVITPPAATTPR